MRILFVNDVFGYRGNVEQGIAEAAGGLQRRGHVVALAYASAVGNRLREYARLFDTIFRYTDQLGHEPDLDSGGDHQPELTGTFAQIVDSAVPDVIYIHNRFAADMLAGLSDRPRVVRYLHELAAVCPKGTNLLSYSKRPCMKPVGCSCWADLAFLKAQKPDGSRGVSFSAIGRARRELGKSRRYDLTLVSSRYMFDQLLINGFPRDRVAVLPAAAVPVDVRDCPDNDLAQHTDVTGLFLGCTDPDDLERFPKDPVILYVGRLLKERGVDTLLRSLKVLVDQTERAGAFLHIVGSGNYEQQLRELTVELGLDNYVRFHGWISHAQLGRLYGEAKVVAMPSHWPEPFGATGLEAMNRARPVVGANVGAIPEWLSDGETGYLVPPKNVDSLAKRLSDLLYHTETAWRLGMEGRKRVRMGFAFDEYLTRLEAYLSGAVAP